MDSARPSNPQTLLSLQEAALKLGVGVDVLLRWNEHNILKPTITLGGHIGYTFQQLEEFQTIRQAIEPHNLNSQQASSIQPALSLHKEENLAIMTSSSTLLQSSNKLPSPLLVSSAAILLIILTVMLIAQDNLKPLADISAHTSFLSSQSSNFTVPQAFETTGQNRSINSQTTSIFSQKFATQIYQKDPIVSTQKERLPATGAAQLVRSIQGQMDTIATKAGAVLGLNASTTTNTSVLSEIGRPQSKNTNKTTSTLDGNGNITGQTSQSDTIALLAGNTSTLVGSAYTNPTNLKNQLLLLVMVIFAGGVVYLRKQQKPALIASQSPATGSHALTNQASSEKILEIDQKMDGTVILSFQGNVYKISKPELYSDSDRFIERLMELVGPYTKEIEYDSWTDEKLRLSAPLSRLVTRLGFVGVKRDLFFPRTSKNRVLFRKYVTQKDLVAMNITTQQLAKELTLFS